MSSDLEVGEYLGGGGFGNVYRAKWKGLPVAIKRFPITQRQVDRTAEIKHEVEIMKELVYDHIIHCHGATYYEGELAIIMSYVTGGSLQQAIDYRLLKDWPTKTRIAQEIVRGLNYIHNKKILHRDLKSMNVLLTHHMEVKLCDFGLATIKTQSMSNSTATPRGTLRWMAPELFAAKPKYSTKSDMYALAVVMWEMAANRTTPFKDQTDNAIVMALVQRGEREELPDDTPAEYRQWVKRCWDNDPAMRPEARELVTDVVEPGFADVMQGNVSMLTLSMDASFPTVAQPSSGSAMKLDGSGRVPTDSFAAALAKAKGGDVVAQVVVAAMCEKGEGVAQSDAEAFKWYLDAAEQGSTEAEHKVGDFYFYGRGTQQRYDQAIEWRLRAAAKGHLQAQVHVGETYQYGHGIARDDGEAVSWYRKAAERGFTAAQNNLGHMYQHGFGVQQDHTTAVSWYRRSAEQGYAAAQNNLGHMYQHGLGVGRDYRQAVVWFRKSAEQGFAAAQNNLGHMYQHGLGVDQKEFGEAVSWFRKAADQEDSVAQNNLGDMYQQGLGVERDYKEAVHWYRKSAEKGNAVAQKAIASMYQHGRGVQTDIQQAIDWLGKCAEQGDVEAKTKLKTLRAN